MAGSMILIVVGHYTVYFASFIPVIGELTQVVVYGILAAYFTGYAMSLIESSTQGAAEPPDLPQLSEFQEAIRDPLVFVAPLGTLTVGPYLLYISWLGDPNRWIGRALLLPGLSYLPMGLLCVSLDSSIKGFNPVSGVRAIAKVPREYLVIWGMVMFVTALEAIGGWAMRRYLPGFVAGFVVFVLQQACSCYLLFVAARLTGLLYHTTRSRLTSLAA